MKARIICMIAALGLLVSPLTKAEENEASASYLLKRCKTMVAFWDKAVKGDDVDTYDLGFCAGFITSSSFDTELLKEMPRAKPICFPANIRVDQLVRIVVKHLEAHPEVLNGKAGEETFVAWRAAFPCRQPAPK